MLSFQLSGQDHPYQNPNLPQEERIDNLLSILTPEEKLSWMDQHQPAISRLGIPYFTTWTEGLHGLAWAEIGTVTATQFPQAKGLANTWSPEVLEMVGQVEGIEARVYYKKYGGDGIGLVLRAPMIDMGRDIRWGRTEESFGEDPFLVSELAKGMIRGIQGNDPNYLLAATTLKHFVANNNEVNRDITSSDFDERDLREYYIAPFRESLVYGNARSFMTGYNLVNGIPATVTPLVNDIVIDEWGFNGMVCTDAYAYYNLFGSQGYFDNGVDAAAGVVLAGTNVFVDFDREALKTAFNEGLLTETDIDEIIRGNIKLRFDLGLFDPVEQVPYNSINAGDDPWLGESHQESALKATEKSIVLLKNTSLLPLKSDELSSIAVIGPNATEVYRDWYGGNAASYTSILDGLKTFEDESLTISYHEDDDAVAAASSSDVAILCIGSHPTCGNYNWAECDSDYEGRETVDRKYIELDPEQVELVQNVKAVNPNTIVVLVSGYPQAIQWIDENIDAVLHVTHSSQALGTAVANTIFGVANPAGRTVFSWPSKTEDLPNDFLDYNIREGRTYMYSDQPVLYPFGHGLSYTDFEYKDLSISNLSPGIEDTIQIGLTVANIGEIAGDEVVQVYAKVNDSAVERPIKQLIGFDRISVEAGAEKAVDLSIPIRKLSYWDQENQTFRVESGEVEFHIGASSADIRLTGNINVQEGGPVRLVPEIEEQKPLRATPNVNNNIRVYYDDSKAAILEINDLNFEAIIVDLNGKIIGKIPLKLYSQEQPIDLSELSSKKGIFAIIGKADGILFNTKYIRF